MITETLLNSLKSLFSSLGAKTSDSNYAVGLFDKTNGEPKGMMGMSDLASVLGVIPWKKIQDADTCYDSGFYSLTNGVHGPLPYGVLLVIAYREQSGNTKPDFAAQMFFPNGDTANVGNAAWYRTSISNSWNSWQRIGIQQ